MHRFFSRASALLQAAIHELAENGLIPLLQRMLLWTRRRAYLRRNDQLSQADLLPPLPSIPPKHARSSISVPTRLNILYVMTTHELLSRRYRVENIREQLEKQGAVVKTWLEIDAYAKLANVQWADVIVFQRIVATPEMRQVVNFAQQQQIPCVFEIDDYLFEPSMVESIAGLNLLSPIDRAIFDQRLIGHRAMLEMCPYFIGTTHFLADRARELGRKSYVIRNGLSDEQIALADKVLTRKKLSSPLKVRIGYLSGTNTHHQDFAVVVPALIRIMQEYPNVILVIRGYLEIPDELKPFADRIECYPFIKWQKLIEATATLDITIAPLEDNPFTQAKSALKYFESGLVSVPCIASPTEDFQAAIRHGENGLLASTEQDWFDCLALLVSNSTLRQTMGELARQDVLTHYTSTAQSAQTYEVFREIIRDQRTVTS